MVPGTHKFGTLKLYMVNAMNRVNSSHPAWIEIDLQQFKKNIRIIQDYIGQRKLCLPVKANAYGHGLLQIAKTAQEAKVDYLAVSCLQEAAFLREAGLEMPILVLGAIHEEQIPELLKYQLEFTISSLYKAKLTAAICLQLKQKGKVHVEIDTGMQRTGVRPDTAVSLLNYLYEMNCFEVVGVYSHLATADNPNDAFAKTQIQIFHDFVQQHVLNKNRNLICHLANSGGLCYFPESMLDMVRPGLLAFGYFPSEKVEALNGIAPLFSVRAKISYFKTVEAHQGISYGHHYITNANTRIITIPVGYGDGYRRALSKGGYILHRGQRFPIAGSICMDQFMVDIDGAEAYVGDEVTLIGKQGNEEITLEEISKKCDTIIYEILCGFNERLPHFYL